MTRFRAVIFDFDGVIRFWDETETQAIEERHQLPAGAILAASFVPDLLHRAVCGLIDDEDWRAVVRDALRRDHGSAGEAAVDEWCRLDGRIDPDMLELIAGLPPGVRTGLLTNATTRLESDLALHGLDGRFDAVISSARVGFAKPDRRIFQVAADRLGCQPAECVFTDDRPAFAAAARDAGMHAIDFAGAADLRAQLHDLLARG
jgi:putative hydrolase of the HAD superfamily